MTTLLAVAIVLLMGAVAVVASGRGEGLPPADIEGVPSGLPTHGPITAEDLRRVRFNTAMRGYRADEVDALLERLAAQLDDPARPEDGHRP